MTAQRKREQPQADAFIQHRTDEVAEQTAEDRGEGRDRGEAYRLLGLGEAHQAEQRVRRDREEARFDEGEQRQPPLRGRVRGLLHRPFVQSAQHLDVPSGQK